MAVVEKQEYCGFNIRLISESIVKAAGPNMEPYILPLSSFDRLVAGFTITYFHAYRRPSEGDFASILATIKDSLSETLRHFHPFAGRVSSSSKNGQVLCNNSGARVVEASADFSLASVDFYLLSKATRTVMLPIVDDIPLNVQVTRYTCGGFSISWSLDHSLTDATGIAKFWTSWCEIARGYQVTAVCNHDRSIMLPRYPRTYSALIDLSFTFCPFDEIHTLPPPTLKRTHLYYVKGSSIEKLRAAASESGCIRTRNEAISAYLWKVMARTLDDSDNARCQMGWVVEGRRWISSNFIGNLVSMAVQEKKVKDIREQSLAQVATTASNAIRRVLYNKDHFLDLNDFVDCHRPGIVCANSAIGVGAPALVVNACHHMPMMSTDFGFGLPSLCVALSAQESYAACFVNIVSSGRDDGSWFVSAVLWPELAAALESDPQHIFCPITADHIFGCDV